MELDACLVLNVLEPAFSHFLFVGPMRSVLLQLLKQRHGAPVLIIMLGAVLRLRWQFHRVGALPHHALGSRELPAELPTLPIRRFGRLASRRADSRSHPASR